MVNYKVIGGLAGVLVSGAIFADSLFFANSVQFGERYMQVYDISPRMLSYLVTEDSLDTMFRRRDVPQTEEIRAATQNLMNRAQGFREDSVFMANEVAPFNRGKRELSQDEQDTRYFSGLGFLLSVVLTYFSAKQPKKGDFRVKI